MAESIWNLASLKEHLDSRINSVEKAVVTAMAASEKATAAAMAASEKAISKAEAAAEKRSDAANEIRQAMIDQQAHFADKDQTDFRLSALSKQLDLIAGRSQGVGLSMSALVQIVSTLAAATAVILFLRH